MSTVLSPEMILMHCPCPTSSTVIVPAPRTAPIAFALRSSTRLITLSAAGIDSFAQRGRRESAATMKSRYMSTSHSRFSQSFIYSAAKEKSETKQAVRIIYRARNETPQAKSLPNGANISPIKQAA